MANIVFSKTGRELVKNDRNASALVKAFLSKGRGGTSVSSLTVKVNGRQVNFSRADEARANIQE